MTFISDPQRDAANTIAGFIFQVNTTVVRWLDLQPNEALELERGEDIDIVQQELKGGIINESRILEQIKRRSSTALWLESSNDKAS